MGVIIAILVLAFMVFFHELGHFLIARLCGVKVEAFAIGFGSKKLVKKTINGTEYSIRPFPLGGFVSLKGQADFEPQKRDYSPDSFYGVSIPKRIAILAAGPAFNILLAFFLYIAVAFLGQNRLVPVIGEISADSPAFNKLQKGDEIISINGEKIYTWQDLSEAVSEFNIKENNSLQIGFLRNNNLENNNNIKEELFVNITPKIGQWKNIFGEIIERPLLGVASAGEVRIVKYSFLDSIPQAAKETWRASTLIAQSVIKLISGVVSPREVGGVVSIVSITKKASELGIVMLFMFAALISVNLGILNLLPIPALDGGHIIFAAYESIRRRPPSINAITRLTICGWVVLGSLMVLGLFNDINRIIDGSMPF